jgi:hypothetical protein
MDNPTLRAMSVLVAEKESLATRFPFRAGLRPFLALPGRLARAAVPLPLKGGPGPRAFDAGIPTPRAYPGTCDEKPLSTGGGL